MYSQGDGAPYIHRDKMRRVFTGDGAPYIHRDKMQHVFTQGDSDPYYTACECQLFADCGRIACVPTLWVKRRLVELTTTKTTKTTKTKGMLLHVVPVVIYKTPNSVIRIYDNEDNEDKRNVVSCCPCCRKKLWEKSMETRSGQHQLVLPTLGCSDVICVAYYGTQTSLCYLFFTT